MKTTKKLALSLALTGIGCTNLSDAISASLSNSMSASMLDEVNENKINARKRKKLLRELARRQARLDKINTKN